METAEAVVRILEERHESYGNPEIMYSNLAKRWGVKGPEDVVLMMLDLKMARLQNGLHADSVDDVIGYALILRGMMS